MAKAVSPEDQAAIDSMNNDDDFDSDPDVSLEDRADDEPDEAEPEPTIRGTKGRRQLSLLAGGEDPDMSSFKMQGGKIAVEGEFEKGTTVDLYVKVRIAEVHFVDKVDDDGYVVSTDRRHIAKPLSIQRTET